MNDNNSLKECTGLMKSSEEKATYSSLNYGKTFIIGFGFFTTAITWSLYNSYVPIFLRKFILSATLIGIII